MLERDSRKFGGPGLRILGFPTMIIWGGLTWVGVGLQFTVRNEYGAGHPTRGQLIMYVLLPLALTFLALAAYAVAHFTRFKRAAAAVHIALLACVLPFMMIYARGM
jgi:hypothetical protein